MAVVRICVILPQQLPRAYTTLAMVTGLNDPDIPTWEIQGCFSKNILSIYTAKQFKQFCLLTIMSVSGQK